ncbi:MAG: hypothetical protein AB1595_00010 [bacterium]
MKERGFEYYLEDEVIERYKKQPYELRLKWLYFGSLLRKKYPKKIIKIQERFRRNEE